MLLANKRWEFQDANWFPDFPASAQKLSWFYRKSRNVTVDGMIAINADFLPRLLALGGDITDTKRGLTLTAENVLPTLQTVVEEGPEKKDHKPKQVIADLASTLVAQWPQLSPEKMLAVLASLQTALETKEIQASFTDASAQTTMSAMGWSGAIAQTDANQDYLMVVNTNIQGQKSDARIEQTISHQTEVQADGSLVNTVVITRVHTGDPAEKFYGSNNVDYIRVYVPEGSELISAHGFSWPDEKYFKAPYSNAKIDADLAAQEQEIGTDPISGTRITKEFGKTAFGNWVVTAPGEQSQIQFTYRLPFTFQTTDPAQPAWKNFIKNLATTETKSYQLVVQRQSGSNSVFESQLIGPANWEPIWYDGPASLLMRNGLMIGKQPLTQDTVWSMIFKKSIF
jgi:hypothetical protein